MTSGVVILGPMRVKERGDQRRILTQKSMSSESTWTRRQHREGSQSSANQHTTQPKLEKSRMQYCLGLRSAWEDRCA